MERRQPARREPFARAVQLAEELLAKVGRDKRDAALQSLRRPAAAGGHRPRAGVKPSIMLLMKTDFCAGPRLVGDVLEVMKNLASEGMTMVIVARDEALPARVADRVIFIDQGIIQEEKPELDLTAPVNPRTAALSKVL